MKNIVLALASLLALACTASAQSAMPDRLCINDPQHGWIEVDAKARTFSALVDGQQFSGQLELFEPTLELEYVMVNGRVEGFSFFSNLTWKRHASFARVVLNGRGFEMWNREHNDCNGQPSTAEPWTVHIYPARPEGQAPLSLMLCAAPNDFATLTNYEWSINGVTVFGNMIPFTFVEPGEYKVSVRAIYIDITAENEITVKVKAKPEDDPPPNIAPTVSISADRVSGKVKKKKPLTVNLSAAATDQDGQIASYLWQFSDGTTATGATAQRAYTKKGIYTEIITVTDDRGAQANAEIVITVR